MSLSLPGLDPHEVAALIPAHPILVCYRGSHSHGTYVSPSDPTGIDDIDILACYIPPGLSDYFGIQRSERGHDKKIREWDCAAYEIRHLARLLMGANPNLMCALWADDYLLLTRAGAALVRAREVFSTRVAAASFSGYAYSQLKRMTHISEESSCCAGEQFHLEGCPLQKERGRGSQKKFATGFMGAKRKALVERHGYDTKNAAHLIRLLRMGVEFLADGVLRVNRRTVGDADELVAIKRGEWRLTAVKALAEDLFSRFDAARAASPLPEHPDQGKIDRLLVEILSVHWNQQVSAVANSTLLERLTARAPSTA